MPKSANESIESEYKDHYKHESLRFECKECTDRQTKAPSANNENNYSTVGCIETSGSEKKPDIHKVIFNDKFALLNPTNKSDVALNFVEPARNAYRKKRTTILYPTPPQPYDDKSYLSEYKEEFHQHNNNNNKH